MRTERTIVAADAWYEWTGEKPNRQQWRIHRKDGGVLFIPALPGPYHEDGATAASGFALVTLAVERGLVDIHDRRPVVFTADDAQLWLAPDLPAEQPEQLARFVALGPEMFGWHKVGKAIGNSRNESPSLAEPIEDAQEAACLGKTDQHGLSRSAAERKANWARGRSSDWGTARPMAAPWLRGTRSSSSTASQLRGSGTASTVPNALALPLSSKAP